MASDVDICNLALLRLGTRSSISSLTEGSAEANACALAYPTVRDALLSQHRWSFAGRQASIALLAAAAGTPENGAGAAPLPPQPWRYKYAVPADFLQARQILPPMAADCGPRWDRPRRVPPVPYRVWGDADQAGNPRQVILTDQPQAILDYTARVTAAALFDAAFVEALSWLLAAEIAFGLTGDKDLGAGFPKIAAAVVANVKANDANQALTPHEHEPDWVRVRGAGAVLREWGRW